MTKIFTILLLCGFCNITNVNAQFGDNWDFDLPCDSLIAFDCNGELIELSICNLDWEIVEECFFIWDWNLDSIDFGDWEDDWDWNLDSLDLGDWEEEWDWNFDSLDLGDWMEDWDWNLDSLDFGDWEEEWDWNLDSLDLGDWEEDWDWNLDSLDFGDWDDDWDWNLDSLDFGDWYDDWDWNLDSLDFDDWDDDWDWDLDSLDFGDWEEEWDWNLDSLDFGDWVDEFPCDSLVEFECNGTLIEFSVCDIDWDALIDCLSYTDSEDGENMEDGDVELSQQELPEENEDKQEYYNPIIEEIFPNPFINQLDINITNYGPGTIEITIVDVKGGVIHNEEVELPCGGKFVVPININANLPNGMYQINILNANKQIIKTKNLIAID